MTLYPPPPRLRPRPRQRRPRMSGRVRATLLVIALVPVLVGAGITAYALTRHAVRPAGAGAPTAAVAAGPIRLRVADLMRTAGCRGAVIETQLYSYETGRCRLPNGAEITIAVFDSRKLRTQWLDVAKSFGGNPVAGDGWAAIAATPGAADVLVDKLNGTRV